MLVVGGGSIAKRHFRNLQILPGVEVIACTRNREIADEFHIETYVHLSEALAREPRAAVIANVTSRHVSTAIEAAECGCDLLIEKPLSNSLHDVDRLVALTQNKALITMIGCNLRFHPGVRAVKKALDSHVVGGALSAAIHCGSYLPEWRPNRDYRTTNSARLNEGGGVIMDLIHELDYACWLFGDVERVAAFAGRRSALEIETEDVADILVQFRSGMVAQVHLDYVQRPASRGCRVIGTAGTLIWDNERGRVTFVDPSFQEDVLWAEPPGFDRNEPYRAEMKHFLQCIETRSAPLIGLEDGIRTLRVALAAKRSSEANRVELM